MKALKIIKSIEQYHEYCDEIERMGEMPETEAVNDRIEHLLLLIGKWDKDHSTIPDLDPVQYLKSLMETRNLKSRDLVHDLKIDKTLISAILNYRKGISKSLIRDLAQYFKVSQEAFNRPYRLVKRDLKAGIAPSFSQIAEA